MIIVHHLNNSRSQRVLWLLEELGVPYDIKFYQRDKKTNLAPPELKKIHPLGKSPVVEDGGRIYAETGAILEHIVDAHGGGKLAPARGTAEYDRYKYWLHAAEGSYMPPLVLALFLTRMETAKMPFFAKPIAKRLTQGVRDAYLNHTTKALFDYLDTELGARPWLAGPEFTAADIIMSFPIEAAQARIEAAKGLKNVPAYLKKIHARPAFARALEKGGPYAYA
ncbi:MAG: glutathione S-transferase [Parvularculaceae bacterium]